MDPLAAKYIGAGIACIGMGGAVIWENPHHAEYAGHTTIENES